MTDTTIQATDDAALAAHHAAVEEWAGRSPPLTAIHAPLIEGWAYSVWGWILFAVSMIAVIIAIIMDTSVEGYTSDGPSRIVNIGLQQRQSMLALFAATTFIGSLLLIAVGSIVKRLNSEPVSVPIVVAPIDDFAAV
jgi:hypothetical protein